MLVFGALMACPPPAAAVPARIIILRHGEKQDAFALCGTGLQRALALRSAYLGKGASPSLFATGEMPAAFLTITLHSLELVSPAAASWDIPSDCSVVPLKGVAGWNEDEELDARTREAAADILNNPVWNGKTIVVSWEHKHIASEKIEKAASGPATLRTLLRLDVLGKKVPKTWSGTNTITSGSSVTTKRVHP